MKTVRSRSLGAFLIAATLFCLPSVHAETIVNSGTAGAWTTPTTWTPNTVPAATDSVYINKAGTVSLSGSGAAASLTVSAGGTLSVIGNPFATIQTVNLNAGGTISGTNDLINFAGSWNINGGTLDYNGKKFYMGTAQTTLNSGSIIANEFRVGNVGTTGWFIQNGGVVTSTKWLTIGEGGTYGEYTFNNGALTQSGASLVVGVSGTGTFNMNGGVANLNGGAIEGSLVLGWKSGASVNKANVSGGELTETNKGIILKSSGSELNVSGGTVKATNISGPGKLNVSGGTVKVGTLPNADNASITGGTVVVTGGAVTGNLTVSGGTLASSGTTIAVSGNAVLNGDLDVSYFVPTATASSYNILTTGGTISGSYNVVSGRSVPLFLDPASVTQAANNKSITASQASDAVLWNGTDSPWAADKNVFVSTGTLAASTNPAAKSVTIAGAGVLNVTKTLSAVPEIYVNDGGRLAVNVGIWNTNFAVPNVTVDGGTVTGDYFKGAGKTVFNSGTMSLGAFYTNYHGSEGSFIQNGGTLTTNNWMVIGENASASDVGYTMTGGVATHNGNGTGVVVGCDNRGVFNMTGGTFYANGKISGNFDADGYSMSIGWGNGDGSYGIVNISGGQLNALNGLNMSPRPFTSSAKNEFNQTGGEVNITGKGLTINDGAYKLSSGTLNATSITGADKLSFTGGTLTANTITGDLVQDGGVLTSSMCVPTMTINGNLTQNAGSILVPYGGSIAVTGSATLNGTIDLSSLGYVAGNHTILTSSATSGNYTVEYGKNSFYTVKTSGDQIVTSIDADTVVWNGATATWKTNNWQNPDGSLTDTISGKKAYITSGTITGDYQQGDVKTIFNDGTMALGAFYTNNGSPDGYFIQNGGTLTASSWMVIGENAVGSDIGYTMTGGVATQNGVKTGVVVGCSNRGVFNLTGGTFNASGTITGYGDAAGNSMSLGWGVGSDSYGEANVSGGQLNILNGLVLKPVNSNNSAKNVFNQTGGEVNITGKGLKINDGAYKLSGGTLNADSITTTGAGSFLFTGGTLNAGTVTGLLTQAGGTISPAGVGTIGTTTLMRGYTMNGGSYQIDIDTESSSVGADGKTYYASDLITVDGTATLDGLFEFVLPENYVDDYSQYYVVMASPKLNSSAAMTT